MDTTDHGPQTKEIHRPPFAVLMNETPRPTHLMARAARFLIHSLQRAASHMATGLQSWAAVAHPRPVLVFGNQKSGTTAIAALLGELTRHSVTLDLEKEMMHPSYHRVHAGQMSIEAFVQRNRLAFSRDIVKEPNLIVVFDELCRYFQESPRVFVVRDPRDNIRSVLNRLDFPGNLRSLPGTYQGANTPTWNLYLDGRWLGIDAESYIDVLAGRWNLAAKTYLEHRDQMILISYEEFLADKVTAIKQLAARLELSPKQDIADKVDIAYQLPGDRSVTWNEFFGPDNLARIEELCGSIMRQLGY